MAYVGKWGAFIHIPKTGGSWVSKVLSNTYSQGHNDGHGHGYPMSWHYNPIFTFVRNPVFWLRSAWGHLHRQGWMPYPHIEIPWAHFVMMAIPFASDSFEEFAINIEDAHKGIVTWLFKCYCAPKVIVHQIENPEFLKNAGCDITLKPIGTGGNLPEISPDLYYYIQTKEIETFKLWYPNKMLK